VVRPNENWWDPYTQGGTKRNYCVASVEPDVSASSDGYYFRVKKATLWRTNFTEPPEDGREYFDQLYMQITVSNPFLWMYEQQGLRWMWAVDSQGTYYTSFEEADDNTQNHIQYTVYRSGLFTYTYDLSFRDTENDMTWIELHYDRDGRDLVFRVDLAGGGENAG
jgi:hypothetical protein